MIRQEAVPRAIIRPAAAHDLARIEEIYDAIHTAEEAGNVSIGWVRGVYPTRATAQAALDAGELFVLADGGTVYAAGRINREQVPVYAEVPWAHDVPPEQVLVLHARRRPGGRRARLQDAVRALLRTIRPGARWLAARSCASTRTRKTPTPAGSTPISATARPGVVPCTFNGIDGVALVCLEKWLGAEP